MLLHKNADDELSACYDAEDAAAAAAKALGLGHADCEPQIQFGAAQKFQPRRPGLLVLDGRQVSQEHNRA